MDVPQLELFLPRDIHKRAPAPALTTVNGVVMSVVYYTALPTFNGPIGGYTTVGQGDDLIPSASASISRARNSGVTSPQSAAPTNAYPSSLQSDDLATSTPAYIANTAAYPTASASNTDPYAFGSTATNSSSKSSSSQGMSVGAKIGLGAGIICGLGVIAIIFLMLLARKRRQQEQNAVQSEKKQIISQPSMSDPAGQFKPNAPRLSLRPVSRLIPDLIGGDQHKNRLSHGNALNSIDENGTKAYNMSPISPASQNSHPATDRSKTADNPFNDPENPFADPEKGLRSAGATTTVPINSGVAAAPVSSSRALHNKRTSGPSAESFPIPQSKGPPPAALPLAMPVPQNANNRYELPASAPSPVIAQGPGPEVPGGNVYRIHMDFRPTMDDELELRAGQLVRMLHEYDDGWALCIRLDRSQQGVVPRTCLAAKPSKPRPGPGPGSRPMTPQGRPRGPSGTLGPQGPPRQQSTAGQDTGSPVTQSGSGFVRNHSPVTPDTGAFNQTPRPLSPGPRPMPQKRSISPEVSVKSAQTSPRLEQSSHPNQPADEPVVRDGSSAPVPTPTPTSAPAPAPAPIATPSTLETASHPTRSTSPGLAI